MKLLTYLFLFLSVHIVAQETLDKTLMHDDIERDYRVFIPSNYDAGTPVPLLFSFHGFGSNGLINFAYTKFSEIAEEEGFIVVHPQGTELDGTPHWNVGGWTVLSTTDDIGFTEAMIEEITSEYSIDTDRIYSTGMSNGGYMSFQLACRLSDKFAAVASVTGSMTPQIVAACDPQHPTPVLQIHGDQDGTVPYNGGAGWTLSIDDVMAYWIEHNNCDTEPEIIQFEDIDSQDNSTAEHFIYNGGDNGTTAEHIKVTGGDHDWPGAFGNMDINASREVWKFLSRYDINGLIESVNNEEVLQEDKFTFYPNPANDVIYVHSAVTKNASYELYSIVGTLLHSGQITQNYIEINVSDFPSNMYLLKLEDKVYKIQIAK